MAINRGDTGADVTATKPQLRVACRFGEFMLRDDGLFRCDRMERQSPVALGSRALEVLTLLLRHAGEVVTKQAIIAEVWSRTAVEDSNLAVQISTLRRILDGANRKTSCIRTITSRGYRFVTPVRVQTLPEEPAGQGLHIGATRPARRMSMIVLPFRWHADDKSGATRAEAFTEALTIELGRLSETTVIASEVARAHQASPIDLAAIRDNLQVCYAIEGSIGATADELYANASLVATETGVQLWADRLARPLTTFAADQEALLLWLSPKLHAAMIREEGARSRREHPTDPDAFDLVIRAQALRHEPASPQRFAEAKALFKRAVALDPESLPAISGLAELTLGHYADRGYYWLDGEQERLAELIARAQSIAPADPLVLTNTASLLEYQGQYEAAMAINQRLIDTYPHHANGYARLARCKIFCGEAPEAIPLLEKAIQLNPQQPDLYDRTWRLGFAHLLSGNDAEALVWFRRSLGACPDAPEEMRGRRYRLLSSAYALLGEVKRAADLLRDFPAASSLVTLRCLGYENYRSAAYAEQYERYRDGLRLAGLRDHADEHADFGIDADEELHPPSGPTPLTAPGAETIGTDALVDLLARETPVVLDTLGHFWGRSLPHAIGLPNSGTGGRFTDSLQGRLGQTLRHLTAGNVSAPIVAVGFNAERFDGRNLALRLVALGYTNVHWYRGGREAWEIAGLTVAPLMPRSW